MATTTIAISQDAYKRLKKFKGPGDTFSAVLLRELPEPLGTAGEVLDYFEAHDVPKANPKLRQAVRAGRGRRSRRS